MSDPLALVDSCTRSQPRQRCNHCALVALVIVKELGRQLQRRSATEKAIGPAAREQLASPCCCQIKSGMPYTFARLSIA